VTRFRNLAVVTAVTVYLQIVLGGVVRITGSGLACPDWPACQGRAIPDFTNYRVAIEYSHRLFATAATLLMLATAAVAVTMYRRQRAEGVIPVGLVSASVVGVGLIAVQVVLGGVTVLVGNTPFTVAIHLGNALLVLAAALLVALWAARLPNPAAQPAGRNSAAAIYSGAVAAYAIVITGAYVVGSGAGLACGNAWPRCTPGTNPLTQVDPAGLASVHMLHRLVVLVAGLVILLAMALAWRRWQGQGKALIAALTASLLMVEVAVGALQVLNGLPSVLRALHLALATGVWSGTALTAAAYWLETRAQRAGAGLRHLATQAGTG
jgi:heme A synthase